LTTKSLKGNIIFYGTQKTHALLLNLTLTAHPSVNQINVIYNKCAFLNDLQP